MATPYKLQVELNPAQMQSLNDLQEAGDLRTKKELLDNAFTLLKWAVKQKQEGNLIVSMNPETGAIKELELPYLQNAKEKYALGSAQVVTEIPALLSRSHHALKSV